MVGRKPRKGGLKEIRTALRPLEGLETTSVHKTSSPKPAASSKKNTKDAYIYTCNKPSAVRVKNIMDNWIAIDPDLTPDDSSCLTLTRRSKATSTMTTTVYTTRQRSNSCIYRPLSGLHCSNTSRRLKRQSNKTLSVRPVDTRDDKFIDTDVQIIEDSSTKEYTTLCTATVVLGGRDRVSQGEPVKSGDQQNLYQYFKNSNSNQSTSPSYGSRVGFGCINGINGDVSPSVQTFHVPDDILDSD